MAPQPARITQVPINIVEVSVQPVRLTQVPVSIVYLPPQPVLVTQVPINLAFPLDPEPPAALLPMWPIEERWDWLTTVTMASAGREQRMALRQQPFLRIDHDLALRGDRDRQTAFYTLWRYIGRRLNYPLFAYSAQLAETAPFGATELVFDPVAANCRAGEPVAVWDDVGGLIHYRLLATGALTATGIALAEPLDEALPAGRFIAPAPLVRIADNQAIRMGVMAGSAPLTLEIVPPRALLRPGQDETPDMFDGLPILPGRFLNPPNHEERIQYNLETLDTGLADPVDRRSWRGPQIAAPRRYSIRRDSIDEWRAFGTAVHGRRNPFLAPSFRSDFALSAQPAHGATVMVTGDTYVADYFKRPGNRYLRIVTANGVIYRRVADAVLGMDRKVTIKLAQALGSLPGDNEISMISLMPKCRLGSDTMTVSHFATHAEVAFSAMTVDA